MSQQNSELPKLPMWRGLLYSSGNMSSQLLQWAFGMFLVFFYCPNPESGFGILLPVSVVTFILAMGRFLDGFMEPLIGYWSDRTRTRWGRRMPYLIFGGLPMCILFLLLWFPPFQPNSWGMVGWLVVVQTLFWWCITIVFCPYLALLGEIVRTNKERIMLSQLMQVFLLVGTALVMILQAVFAPIRAHPEVFIIITVLAVISIYAVPLGVPEKKYCGEHDEEHYGLIQALKWTFTNRAFVIYLFSSLLMWLGFQVLMNGLIFVVTVLLKKPEGHMLHFFGIIVVSVAISFAIIIKYQETVSKKFFYCLGSGWMAAVLPMIYFLGQDSILGIPVLPFAYVFFFLAGFPVAVIMSLGLPILADIADYDAKIVGKRREAMFFGAQGFLQKFVIGLSFMIQGYLFKAFGYDQVNNLGVKLLGPVAGYYVFCGFLLYLFFPLNEQNLTLNDIPFKPIHKLLLFFLIAPGVAGGVYMGVMQIVYLMSAMQSLGG